MWMVRWVGVTLQTGPRPGLKGGDGASQVAPDLVQQELAGDLLAGFRAADVARLVGRLQIQQPGDGMVRRAGINDFVVDGAYQDQVAKAVALLFGLGGIITEAIFAAGLDVADLADDDAAGRFDEGVGAVGKGAAG